MTIILRRAGASLLMLLVVSVVSFTLLELAPGDFFADLQADAQVAPGTADALRAQHGLLDGPVVRYGRWLRSFVTGDLGVSLAHRAPVSSVIWTRAGNTLLLTVPALLVTWAVALPLGIWMARHRGRWVERLLGAGTSTLLALPDLLVALLLLLVALRSGLFPTGGMGSPGADDLGAGARLLDFAAHAVLPLAALVATTLPAIVRHVRASAIEALHAPAVLAARGHGIGQRRITLRYLLPLAANPLVSLAGLSVATLLSMSLLIEVVMSWPGLGPLLVEALLARDVHVVLSASMLATALLVLANLAADLTLYTLDPRIRA